MGLDQHQGQITGEWIDTDTGEVQRTRVAPANRAAVRKFLSRFRGRELDVALEATTGWRFVVEELRRIGASVHRAKPAETAGLRGPKKRTKGDLDSLAVIQGGSRPRSSSTPPARSCSSTTASTTPRAR